MPPARIIFWAATLGGIVVSARAILIGPPPLVIAVGYVLAYFAILLSGVFVLRLRMFSDAIVQGNAGARGVVLTFDDGPDPVHTREVLAVLAEHGAKATFFVIGRKAEEHPDVVREIVADGHAVGIHGWAHDRLLSLRSSRRVQKDLRRAMQAIETITGERPLLFRPPIGHTNLTIAREADKLDLETVGWSASARDGLRTTKPKDVLRRITPNLKDGAILLLHDAPERGTRRPSGVAALPEILARIRDRNLKVAHLPDWLDLDQDDDAATGSSTTKRAPPS
ncbi:MAG: polysaccharide deacetylase family protein [Polyangiaceae bacterium]|nr:polysaccharide deacetylase family protein [Polyangiaceae bacterium]